MDGDALRAPGTDEGLSNVNQVNEASDSAIGSGNTPEEAGNLFYSQIPMAYAKQNLPIREGIQSQQFFPASPPDGQYAFSMTQMANALPHESGDPSMQYSQPQEQVSQAAYYSSQPHFYAAGPHAQYPRQYNTAHDAHRYITIQQQQMYHGASPQQMYPQYQAYGIQQAPYYQQAFMPVRHHQQYPISQSAAVPNPRDTAMGYPNPQFTPQTPNQQSSVAEGSIRTGATAGSSILTLQTRIPRGPPRKPRQSGHALWVGNLPPRATVTDLKDHFSREATGDIMSLKLISKSNCAFVNYKTHEACTAAMARFHDSRFHGTRLVCRLRRTSNNNSPAAQTPSTPAIGGDQSEAFEEDVEEEAEWDQSSGVGAPPPKLTTTRMQERYFILKSLTMHDLDSSSRNGVWATQSHNEPTLTEAFENSENVYLIFSANKSGEYYGFARMISSISPGDIPNGPVSQRSPNIGGAVAPAPSSEPQLLDSGPQSIPTPATRWAPKGTIIDDSARGTIFWEADDLEESEKESNTSLGESLSESDTATPAGGLEINGVDGTTADASQGVSEETQQSSGNTFRVEWISTRRVPFYKTRGIRNPWNSNREIKIARDGTELEPSIGRKLIGLFGVSGYPP